MGASALVYEGPEQVALREFPIPSVGADEMLVEVLLAGVDGSEIHMLRGEMQRINELAPVIFGDEIVGRITKIGDLAAERRGMRLGDEVIVEARWPCNNCRACLAGQYYLCELAGVGEGGYGYGWISCAEPPHLWGGYASHVFVPGDALVYRVPDQMGPETALVCGSVLANSYRWTARGGVALGMSVVVIGPGPQGIGCALAAALRGAAVTVVGLERDSARLAAASDMGADHVLALPERSGADEAEAAVRELLGGDHVDVVIDAAGAEASKQLAMALVRPMGTIVNVSVPAPPRVAINWLDALLKEVTMISPLSHPHSVEPALKMGLRLIERGLDPGRLVSHIFSLEESERALRTAAYELEERPTKVAIRPS
jgi:threonine dehydrogenase-like Zn-dependent dehydrogenase